MKNLASKLKRAVRLNKDGKPQSVGRITNETVAEHREQILAGGRRFKYPHQYARNSLIRMTILISIATLVLLILLGWWQLYLVQNTHKFFYRLTQLVPVPVAKVEGEYVRYSDYLMRLNSELHYLRRENAINLNSSDGKRQTQYQKRVALNKVKENAYISKLAEERGIIVTDKEIDDFINQQLNGRRPPVSREEYEKIIRDYYDWSYGEYRQFIHEQLLRRKVALAIDDTARQKAEEIEQQLKGGANFAEVAKAKSDDETTKQNGGDVGFVSKSNDDPNGLIAAVQRLEKDQVSSVIETRSGYYIVKLLEDKNNEVKYARILVSLKELEQRLGKLKNDESRYSEYINVPQDVAPTRQQ